MDMSDIVNSPELGAQPFTIFRRKGEWVRGRFELGEEEAIGAVGNIQPASPRELEQFPEGDRVKSMVVFRTAKPVYTTQENPNGGAQVSDELLWRGERYKVTSVNIWADYGYYEAYAQRTGG